MKTSFQISKIFFFAVSMIIFISSCKKNDEPVVDKTPANFAEIQLKHIKALDASMSDSPISATDATGLIFKVGDVFVYKTNAARYGKFEILKIDPADNYKLTLKITNFADDGSVFMATNSLYIRGTYLCDLDMVIETSETPDDDFHWNRLTSTNTRLDPKHGAKFVKYNFKS